jgi:hypothetical protein
LDEERDIQASQNIVNLFNKINNNKGKEDVTVHIHYVTGEDYIQTSTFNIPGSSFADENTVIGELEDEKVYYTSERMKTMGKEILNNNKEVIMNKLTDMNKDEILVISDVPFGETTSAIHKRKEMEKYLKKRLININLDDKVLLYIIRDSYRFHGVGFSSIELEDLEI